MVRTQTKKEIFLTNFSGLTCCVRHSFSACSFLLLLFDLPSLQLLSMAYAHPSSDLISYAW